MGKQQGCFPAGCFPANTKKAQTGKQLQNESICWEHPQPDPENSPCHDHLSHTSAVTQHPGCHLPGPAAGRGHIELNPLALVQEVVRQPYRLGAAAKTPPQLPATASHRHHDPGTCTQAPAVLIVGRAALLSLPSTQPCHHHLALLSSPAAPIPSLGFSLLLFFRLSAQPPAGAG